MAGSKVHLKLLRGTHPAVSGIVPLGSRHTLFKRSAAVQTKASLATKGEAAPAVGYDRHDPHYPFGRPVPVVIPRRTGDGDGDTKKYEKLVLPESAARVVEDLLAELAGYEGRIESLAARLIEAGEAGAETPAADSRAQPVPENLLPLILALFSRRIAVGNVRAASAAVIESGDDSGKTVDVDLRFTINLPKTNPEFSDNPLEDRATQSLHAMVIEELRAGRISFGEFKRLMGLKNREAVIGFLTEHNITPDWLIDYF